MQPLAVAVITPSTGNCRLEYAQSLARMVAYFAQVRVFDELETQFLVTDGVIGSGISGNYQRLIDKYLDDKETYWTHFLSVEDDMTFAHDCLHILARRELDIVGVNYSTNKGNALRFTAANKNGRQVVTREESAGVEACDYLPQGLTLVRRHVYETLPRPWYLVGYSPQTNQHCSQDYYFSEQAREHGFTLHVDHDASKKVTHIGPRHYTWRDALAVMETQDNG